MMRKPFWFFLLLALLSPSLLLAAMDNYCSAPPYVTRTVAPNIVVLMDNSADMMNPAYPGNYSPNATKDNYYGYFVAAGCYAYSTTKFVQGTVNADGSCPSTAPFRGNLLNWATTSKYDLLQKVLVGGNTVSKQGNAHTVLSIGGDWLSRTDRTYNNCIFKVNNGNMTITESVEGACGLLNDPGTPIALNPAKDFWRLFSRGVERVAEVLAGLGGSVGDAVYAVWNEIGFASHAWAAAQLTLNVNSGAMNISQGEPYSITLEAGGDQNTVYYWTVTNLPAWLSGPTYASTGNKANYQATWSGTPLVEETVSFTVTVTDRDSNTPVTKTYTIRVLPEPLQMITTSLTSGKAGVNYSFLMTAANGTPFKDASNNPYYSWAASGLPTGLSINATTGQISGIVRTPSTSTVSITVTDSAGDSVNRSFTLVMDDAGLIQTNTLDTGAVNVRYLTWFNASGGVAPYTWAVTSGLPPGLSVYTYEPNAGTGYLFGHPTTAGTYNVTIQVTDNVGTISTKTLPLVINTSGGPLTIINNSTMPAAEVGGTYWYYPTITGGTGPYISEWSGLPANVNMVNTLDWYWTPTTAQIGTYSFTLKVKDFLGTVVSKTFTLEVKRRVVLRSKSFNVKADLVEEPLADLNGNGIWDVGETFTDLNGDGVWQGKQGIFQRFWDANSPRARWGLSKFTESGGVANVKMAACVPAAPASSFFTTVQNATSISAPPTLASQLYGAINYYGFNTPYGVGFDGCTNSDPIDNVPCRKNYVLILSSGSDVTGTAFNDPTGTCAEAQPLVQNACFGYKKDLRPVTGRQNVYTYVVNTMGTANNAVLEAAAARGGGKYYDATQGSQLETQLLNALQDILSQAASGTAVSVLTTSSRGIGSMMQAYFLPVRLEGDREISWTGYAQNIWIDPQDNLREDSDPDYALKLNLDKVVKLYFDQSSNETKAALFETLADGTGGGLAACTPSEIRNFDQINYTWEGGGKLALTNPSNRTLFTSTKVLYGTTVLQDFTPGPGPEFSTTMDASLRAALNADPTAPYNEENIVRYVRGECLEGSATGDNACTSTLDSDFRDRRVTLGGVAKVWKLGDIISSTPKVLANTPVNTYHIDYGDSSYYTYVSDDAYRKRSAMAFVGANDGVLHAFRVGYLKDTGLAAGIKALVKKAWASADSDHADVGKEVWGYIPYNAFPYLKYLADPNYCHIYFNDLSVRLVDASLGLDDTVTATDTRVKESWRTILIGGMRFGGACNGGAPAPPMANVGYSAYYALDVTDAENPIPLWEFSDPDLGYASTFPSVVRTGDRSQNGNWYAVFGSGSTRLPKNNTDLARSTPGYIFFLNLKTGELVKKLQLDHNAIVGDILAVDEDKDYNSERIYFGTTYLDTTWKGKLVKVSITAGTVIDSSWTPVVTTLLADNYPFTASPDAAKDASGNVWVYAGSGKYFSDIDEADTAAQIILGLKDQGSPSPAYPWTAANLANQTAATTTGTVSGTQQVCGFTGTSFGLQTVVTSVANPTVTGSNPVTNGWYVLLANGERVITRPLAVGGLVDFLSYKPNFDPCSYGGNSYLYAFGYDSGLAPSNVAIRSVSTTGGVTTGGVTVARGVLLGPGAPPTGEAIIIPPPKEGQEQLKKKIQIATGVIVEAENSPMISVISKIVHWLKK